MQQRPRPSPTSSRLTRPVVRSFHRRFTAECAAWVRAGGHAVLWRSPERAWLVVPRFDRKDRTDLGRWAILDLGKSSYGVARTGPLRGLCTSPVPRDALDIVRDRATRDSIHAGPRRKLTLDCRACGACCKHNDVVVTRRDRRRLGKVALRVLPNGRCNQLGQHNTCRVYASRPDACRDFPPGSECCLFSREDELGVVDGLPMAR